MVESNKQFHVFVATTLHKNGERTEYTTPLPCDLDSLIEDAANSGATEVNVSIIYTNTNPYTRFKETNYTSYL